MSNTPATKIVLVPSLDEIMTGLLARQECPLGLCHACVLAYVQASERGFDGYDLDVRAAVTLVAKLEQQGIPGGGMAVALLSMPICGKHIIPHNPQKETSRIAPVTGHVPLPPRPGG